MGVFEAQNLHHQKSENPSSGDIEENAIFLTQSLGTILFTWKIGWF